MILLRRIVSRSTDKVLKSPNPHLWDNSLFFALAHELVPGPFAVCTPTFRVHSALSAIKVHETISAIPFVGRNVTAVSLPLSGVMRMRLA
jgi:hypothetical protein